MKPLPPQWLKLVEPYRKGEWLACLEILRPLVDRNPQSFVNIATARPEDFKKTTQRIYRKTDAASVLSVTVLPGGK